MLKADPVESMQLLFSVALADGEVTTDEGELLRLFAARLEIPGLPGRAGGPGSPGDLRGFRPLLVLFGLLREKNFSGPDAGQVL